MYICIHGYIYIYIYVCVYMYIHMYMCVCVKQVVLDKRPPPDFAPPGLCCRLFPMYIVAQQPQDGVLTLKKSNFKFIKQGVLGVRWVCVVHHKIR